MLWRTLLPALLLVSAPAAAGGWKTVAHEHGVLVMMRDVPGFNFPEIRTVAVLNANIFDVLGVLSDVGRYPQWMQRCAEARRMSDRGDLEYLTYSRTAAPWPVSDRDAVYNAKVYPKLEQNLIMVKFRAVKDPRVPPRDGIVRLHDLHGYYALKILGPRRVQIDYQLYADPGGWIPTWVGKITAKRSVITTMVNLRKQVRKTRGWYAKRIARWKKLERKLRD
jgi:hypothetical protein